MKCWGNNSLGQLGLGNDNGPEKCGSADCSKTPVDVVGLKSVAGQGAGVSGLPGVMQMSGGGSVTCVLFTDHTVQCWGWGRAGRIGDGSADDDAHGVSNVTGISTAIQIVTNTAHTCALLDDGTVRCWGENTIGQLGVGLDVSPDDCSVIECATTPVQVIGLTGVKSLSEGQSGRHTCALNEVVHCWGTNVAGQLGTGGRLGPDQCGGSDCSALPVEATVLPEVDSIVTGSGHSCAITPENGVICWGENFRGQAGNGTKGNLNFYLLEPVQTMGFEGGTPTPSPVPENLYIWGDLNCSDSVDPIDALGGLRFDAGLSVSQSDPCLALDASVQVDGLNVTFADVDCSGDFSPVDPLKILRADAGLSVAKEPTCPEIGEEVLL